MRRDNIRLSMLTDSHCHLASHRFLPEEVPQLLARAHAAGVSRMITLATCLDDVEANLQLADGTSVHVCVGIHPCDAHQAPDDAVDRLASYVDDPRVCGIGETGLDYYHSAPEGWSCSDFHERQRMLLRQHFELAAKAKLNIVIHTRDREGHASFEDALQIYLDYHRSVRAVFHCYIGTPANARRVLAAGGLVSFGGVATFKNAAQVRESVIACPAGGFMIETDAPYLAPEPHRGARNEPSLVAATAQRLATVRGETLESLAAHTREAATAFFRLS
jgi:TatD DNase family protein